MMSNLLLLAQTQPTTSPTAVAIMATLEILCLIGLFPSAIAIHRRKLYAIPPIPALPSSTMPGVLLAIIAAAILTFIAVLSFYASVLHLDHAALTAPAGVRKMVFIQPLAQLAGAGIAVILLANLRLLPALFYWPQMRSRPIRHAALTWLLVIPWICLAGVIVERIVRATGGNPNAKHVFFTVWQGEPAGVTALKVVAFLSAAVAAPIAEEIVFRGLLQRMIQSLTGRPLVAIVLASLAFAMVHEPWTIQPGVFVLSLFLGLAYFRTGSLLVPIFAHALFNATQLILFMLVPT